MWVSRLRALGKRVCLPGAITGVLFASACSNAVEQSPKPAPVAERGSGPIAPLRAVSALDPALVALGGSLFRDARLSRNGKIACASCHDLAKAGTDRIAQSVGLSGQTIGVNAPTVFNASLNFRQFWDGRALSLEDQADGPLLSPVEMGSSWAKVIDTLGSDPATVQRFRESYANGVTEENVKDALAMFERSLSTPDAPFDRYLRGETRAIGPGAVRGYELFTSYGCTACHQGEGVGGNMFQKLGVMGDYFADRGHETPADAGRYNVTHDEADRHVFKVPSLRNVARTAPYFHDGSVTTLDEAVRVMGRYQLGRDIEAPDVATLVEFLESLTGCYEGRAL